MAAWDGLPVKTPHEEWQGRVLDENQYVVITALSHVVMRADRPEDILEALPDLKRKHIHVRVYREVTFV